MVPGSSPVLLCASLVPTVSGCGALGGAHAQRAEFGGFLVLVRRDAGDAEAAAHLPVCVDTAHALCSRWTDGGTHSGESNRDVGGEAGK